MAWTERFVNAFRGSRLNEDIDEELRFHIDARTRDNLAAGMSPDEAHQDAQRRFGGVLSARERTRDADVMLWLETLAQDVRYALRSFRRSPVTTAIIVASLALAIGASTAMFSIVNAAMLRALPVTDANRIVMLWTANLLNGAMEQNTSLPNMEDWKARTHVFEDMAAYRDATGPLIDRTPSALDTQWIRYASVTDNFFALLGRSSLIGRVFTPDDFTDGRRVAVVTHSLWLRRFGGSADVIGKRVAVGGLDVEIVGVMAEDFWFPTKDVQLWFPATLDPRWQRSHDARGTRYGVVVGRLRPAITVEQARADMRGVAAQLRQQYPQENTDLDVNLVPLQAQVLGKTVPFMLEMLFGAVLCVLLIACANVANLLLALGMARHRELAVRVALGAGRRRIARQLLTESVLLSCAGGGLGLIAVIWSMQALLALAPANIPRLDEVRIDLPVLLFTLGLSVATGLAFGLVPAAGMSRSGSEELTRATTRNSAGGSSTKIRGAFVIGQFAVALVLLAGAGLLIRSLIAIQSVDSGFSDSRIVTAHLLFDNALPRDRRVALYQGAIARVRELPGVRAAGAVGTMFWSGESAKFGLRAVDGRPDKPRDQWQSLTWTTVCGDYFQALGVPLLRGRFFRETDTTNAPPVVLVNETMARRYWPGEDPIGRRIKGFDPRGTNDDWVLVVGVVKDVHSGGLDRAPIAQIFEPQSQSLSETENLVVSATTSGLPATLRRAIRAFNPTAVLADVSTLGERLDEQTAQRRFQTYLLTAFAGLALFLAAAGTFATMHYWVAQRTREIGIRVALGAERRTVMAMVFRETLVLAIAGVGVGVTAAIAATRTIASLLYGVTPHDPATFAAVSVGLTAIALAACCVPALRAASVDPILALKIE